jgi:hypothetical protein
MYPNVSVVVVVYVSIRRARLCLASCVCGYRKHHSQDVIQKITDSCTIICFSCFREDIVVSDLYEKGEQGSSAPSISRHNGGSMALEENNNNLQRSRLQQMQIMADHLIPLPKPVKRLLGRVLIRLAKDGTELVLFVRRQFDAIVGAVRDRITEGRHDRILEEAQRRNREQAVNYDL